MALPVVVTDDDFLEERLMVPALLLFFAFSSSPLADSEERLSLGSSALRSPSSLRFSVATFELAVKGRRKAEGGRRRGSRGLHRRVPVAGVGRGRTRWRRRSGGRRSGRKFGLGSDEVKEPDLKETSIFNPVD